MLKESKLKIKRFVKFIRNTLPNDVIDNEFEQESTASEIVTDLKLLSDAELLDHLRYCGCCKEEIITKDQQLHAILEFDTPLRAYNAMYAHLELESEDV